MGGKRTKARKHRGPDSPCTLLSVWTSAPASRGCHSCWHLQQGLISRLLYMRTNSSPGAGCWPRKASASMCILADSWDHWVPRISFCWGLKVVPGITDLGPPGRGGKKLGTSLNVPAVSSLLNTPMSGPGMLLGKPDKPRKTRLSEGQSLLWACVPYKAGNSLTGMRGRGHREP